LTAALDRGTEVPAILARRIFGIDVVAGAIPFDPTTREKVPGDLVFLTEGLSGTDRLERQEDNGGSSGSAELAELAGVSGARFHRWRKARAKG